MALPTDDAVLTSEPGPGSRVPPDTTEARRATIAKFAALLSESYSRMPMFP